MLLLRTVLLICVHRIVLCDLLDLYVQHMDETMKTLAYRRNHPRNLRRSRARRNAPPEPFYSLSNFKKQLLDIDEKTGRGYDAKKSKMVFIGKDDGLDFPNDQENSDPREYSVEIDNDTAPRRKTKKVIIKGNDALDFPNDQEDNNFEDKWILTEEFDAPGFLPETVDSKSSKEVITDTNGTDIQNFVKDVEDPVTLGKTIFIEKDDGLDFPNDREENLNPDQHEPVPTEAQSDDENSTISMNVLIEDLEVPTELVSVWESLSKPIIPKEAADMTSKTEPESMIEIDETEDENEDDIDSAFEMVGDLALNGPAIKVLPKIGNRVPKKYVPTSKELKIANKPARERLVHSRHARSVPEPSFTRYEKLDDDGIVILEWDPSDEDFVTFRVTAKTRGYVGIGFNDHNHMMGADIILAWVDDDSNAVNLLDSHGIEESNAAPVTDASQDVEVLHSSQNGTHTSVTFSRRWQTCDPQDHQLTGDTIRVLWAIHETDPELNTAMWHGEKRGGRALRLKAPAPHPQPKLDSSDLRHWDVKLNQFAVPNDTDTTYWCKIFRPPGLLKKHHMIGYTPLVEKANEALVHHIILYECASTDSILAKHTKLIGADCYSGTRPKEWSSCLQPVLAWARGSKGEWLPEHVGIPISEHAEGSYYMLEVHYNNPGFKNVNDSSGVRLHITPKLRKHDAGILVAGVAVSPLLVVPPRQKEYATAGYCASQCTDKMLPEDGINVVSVVLHAHLAGKRLGLKHIRQGKELPRIVQDNHFDFNYQQSHTLDEEVKILPGDELVAECVYSTLDRPKITLGGYSANQEMCLAFVVHYPRTSLAGCYSVTPVENLFHTLGIASFKGISMTDLERLFLTTGTDAITLPTIQQQQQPVLPYPPTEAEKVVMGETVSALRAMKEYSEDEENANLFANLVIENPEEFRGRTLAEHMLDMPWREELLVKSIESSLYYGEHMTYCRKRDDTLPLPGAIQMFPNFTALPETNDTNICSELMAISGSENIWTNSPLFKVLIILTLSISQWRLLVRF
ncbi:MOXD1 homolog 1 [Cephus cinctus]|uniref:MOXD1 homolog 1 n=1 Tax=Cephus cinctus TaxID=211228 RepID=A0AAJ7C0A0_CEPCN|nr:MOXD1 homolog 1 [Cephus cinctus]